MDLSWSGQPMRVSLWSRTHSRPSFLFRAGECKSAGPSDFSAAVGSIPPSHRVWAEFFGDLSYLVRRSPRRVHRRTVYPLTILQFLSVLLLSLIHI